MIEGDCVLGAVRSSGYASLIIMPHTSPDALDSHDLQADPQPLDHILSFGDADDVALILKTRTFTYAELRKRVAEMAGWLSTIAAPGERVASWAAKGEWTCLLPLAAARAGLIHVPINPLLKNAQVKHILSDSGATALVGTAARLQSLKHGDLPQGCVAFSEQEADAQVTRVDQQLGKSSADTGDLAAILYTSGSTGRPKGVMLSHANLWLGAQSVASYLGMHSDDRTLAVLPLSFDYGQSQLLSTWFAGGCVVPLDYLVPRDVVKACAKHAITTLAAVPPLWSQLTASKWPDEAVAAMRRLTNSGGALTPQMIDHLRDIFPKTDIYPMYGLTEAFRSTYLAPELVAQHPTSIGRAIPFAEVLVIGDMAT